jgi:hypothetical protein
MSQARISDNELNGQSGIHLVMPSLSDIEKLLPTLSPGEKAQNLEVGGSGTR